MAWDDKNRWACSGDLNRCIWRSRRRVGRCEFSALLLAACSWAAAPAELGETTRWLYPGITGTGAPGARGVGRPGYLMSCELALLSGRSCDLPGCAASADP